MSQSSLQDYYDALERLVTGNPRVLSAGTKITKDSVSLEAGRGKGTIKKSRAIYADLIVAIECAAAAQVRSKSPHSDRINKLKTSAEDYRRMWEAAIGREICLLQEVYQLKRRLQKLTGENVVPIRGNE